MPWESQSAKIEQFESGRFRLLEDVTYIDPTEPKKHQRRVAHEGLATDLASIPWPLWSVLSPFGRQTRPALVHDQEVSDLTANAVKASWKRRGIIWRTARENADRRLLRMLRDAGVPRFRSNLIFAGAAVGRYWDQGVWFQKWGQAVQLTGGYVLLGWGIVAGAIGADFFGFPWWAPIAAVNAATLLWGRVWFQMWLMQIAAAPFIAIGVLNVCLSLAEWGANWLSSIGDKAASRRASTAAESSAAPDPGRPNLVPGSRLSA